MFFSFDSWQDSHMEDADIFKNIYLEWIVDAQNVIIATRGPSIKTEQKAQVG